MEPLRLRNEQFAALFKKIVLSRYPLDAVAEVEALYKGHDSHPDHEEIKLHGESLISAIYFYNDLPDRSLRIDLEILRTLPSDDSMYYTIINRAVMSSSRSERNAEMLPFVLNYLENPAQEFYKILFLLHWYVQHYPGNGDREFEKYMPKLSSIAAEMGAALDEAKPFSESVVFLVSEFHRADKDLHALRVAYRDEAKERFAEVLDEFLANEPLLFFRNQATNEFKS